MQPQRREVRVENDEFEREPKRLAKQIKRVVVLRNNHILAFCAVQNALTVSDSFNVIRTLFLPSHTFYTWLHMHYRKARATPINSNLHVLVQGHGDARETYASNYVIIQQKCFHIMKTFMLYNYIDNYESKNDITLSSQMTPTTSWPQYSIAVVSFTLAV